MAKKKVLNITEIEDGVKKLINQLDKKSFIVDFLSFYDIPKTSITRAKKEFKEGKDFVIKNKLFYREVSTDVVLAIDSIEQEISEQKSKPRYIISSNFEEFAALDVQTRATLNISIGELPANADFFLAWNGIEKADYQAENPADRKAAERFAKLYDVIAKDNPTAEEHAFNLFLIRVLFLLFAEDTGIIPKAAFTNVLKTRTKEDGSDFNVVITELFEILDVPKMKRVNKSSWLLDFPYVNGKLFSEKHKSLHFTKLTRELLIEAGELLNWREINPDILGAMIQTVASAEERHVSGMHYTSVTNIKKLIKPLFLDELNSAFDELASKNMEVISKDITEKTKKDNQREIVKNLYSLLDRISKIKFLDPASGSGNFLIITYKELRRLEIKILLLIQKIEQTGSIPFSIINLCNFSGIEIDDFAHEVAKLSLWIAEHQMNEEMTEAIPGSIAQLLPLKDAGNIVQGNSLRIDWNTVVPHTGDEEVYIMGNPPYLGSNKWTKDEQKQKDMEIVFEGKGVYRKLDYISAWFIKASEFIKGKNSSCAFVTTNSVTQGEQAPILWEKIFHNDIEIFFGVQNFKWSNSAKGQAAVVVQIIGLSNPGKDKLIFTDESTRKVDQINEYLTEGTFVNIQKRSSSISGLPKMEKGSQLTNSKTGGLLFSEEEYKKFIFDFPQLHGYFRKFLNGEDLLNGGARYVLLVRNEEQYKDLLENKILNERFHQVAESRAKSTKKQTKELAKQPWKIGELRYSEKAVIASPQTASENYDYVPMTILDKSIMASNNVLQAYTDELWLLALLESKMHVLWIRAIGGKMKTDYTLSSRLVYNTFPIPELSTQRKNELNRIMLEILDLREYEGGTLAQLYNKHKMPESLREKHEELNGIVDRAYRQRPFESDEERLALLLNLYKEMSK
ncbi:class I SAM-dependent DNA methyltransferase [Bacillus cereus]|uniref:class I SAM-dependent DNA methyltransferase n=1 Tax=Bacillus cereus TaxID=1396 RepID=UPI000BFC0378|nr:DNA methyltransferase [Bacillus cereus]PGN45489.1 DNA methyltransferase [Bacillus cereus]TBX55246.1 class I SAM-dependent DNA methyltransferase [Bacillus cereus]